MTIPGLLRYRLISNHDINAPKVEASVARYVPRWNRVLGALVLVASCGSIAAQELSIQWTDPSTGFLASTFGQIYAVDWLAGLPPNVSLQIARPTDISVGNDPLVAGRKSVDVTISSNEDFSNLASGAPRAEIVFPSPVRFTSGSDYLVRWSTYLPEGYQPDPAESLVITQIHQGSWSGPPPIMLTIRGSDYQFAERGNSSAASGEGTVCCATSDEGKWIQWALRYIPDASGQHASTQLWKNGTLVYASHGLPNAYPDGQDSYLKIGLYKAAWVVDPSQVSQIVMLYGPVSVGVR